MDWGKTFVKLVAMWKEHWKVHYSPDYTKLERVMSVYLLGVKPRSPDEISKQKRLDCYRINTKLREVG